MMCLGGCGVDSDSQNPPGSDMSELDMHVIQEDLAGPEPDMSHDATEDHGPHDMSAPDSQLWQALTLEWPAALMAVHGLDEDDVWVVGARDALGPTVLHWDGVRWQRYLLQDEGAEQVDLWWVHVLPDGEVLLAGGDGAIFSGSVDRPFKRQWTPISLARYTVFGVWSDPGTGRTYAVGGIGARSGFVWERVAGSEEWRALRLPAAMPKLANEAHAGLFKVWGDAKGTVWFVGASGTVLRRQGDGELELIETPTNHTLFTVTYDPYTERALAVGGASSGVMLSISEDKAEQIELPPATPLIQGISPSPDGSVVAVGARATTLSRVSQQVAWDSPMWGEAELENSVDSLHAVWVDPQGGVWSVGGDVLSATLSQGVVLYRGAQQVEPVASTPQPVEPPVGTCPIEHVRRGSHSHVARRWVEQNLDAIRRTLPQPGVHARNLYHLSVTLFDAYSASSQRFDPLVWEGVTEPVVSVAERDGIMSYAAHTLLTHRYRNEIGGELTLSCLDDTLRDLGFDPDSDDAVAVRGRAIGQAVISRFAEDGSLESAHYQSSDYTPPNPPLEVDEPGLYVDDPTRWQPLDLAIAVSQNGLPLGSGVQGYIGPHWGNVEPFALTRENDDDLYFPQATPLDDLVMLRPYVVDVIRKTSWLTPQHQEMIDTSPASYGNNPLAEDLNQGYGMNPVTGRPYRPTWTRRSDFGRVLAEYWADGPDSETPPGHWNVIANEVMDRPDFEWQEVPGVAVDSELEYALHLYLILNGALHDAAIAAWQLKRYTESARPITLIRWMAMQGQSSDPMAASYHESGLPLIPGLIELISSESSAPGGPHEHLAPYVGELAILSWPGAPGDALRRTSPQAWIRAQEWSTYQPRTFVTPAFPGYVSGHSTFSRSAAEVLSVLTGSPFFPGGLHEYIAHPGETLRFENGPGQLVRLQWATYFDAADQAGQSRIWGGIHIAPDDYDGRRIGAQVGATALTWGQNNLNSLSSIPLNNSSQ